jgi:alkanesulfonate monooxygenase SsuD/methylene tetrahydromethanopterin reductase-like flavin-dependent oxidoreductase (luciferase family)
VRIGYGLITAQRPPDDPRSDADLYREIIERCVVAEQSGFDSVWTSEHHFLDDGYMPSLLVTCAAIAQATERVTIGTAILLAPLHDPIRIAEDAATVDLISGSRFVLGIGAGWRAEEFEVFDVALNERPKRMRETVRVLRGAWGPGTFEYGGRQVNVTPKPARPIPIWIGAFAPPAIKRAGRIADGFLGSSTGTAGLAAFVEAKRLALEARRAGGAPSSGSADGFQIALHVPVYVSSGANPWDEIKQHYHYLRWKYPDMALARGSAEAKPPPPLTPETEEQLRPTLICGSPDEAVEQIAAFREALGDDLHFICRSDFPGLPQAQQLKLIDTIGADVIPRLKS